jgi:hypothetical protein
MTASRTITSRTMTWLGVLTVGLFALGHSIPRDVRYEKEYAGDLRNRIVGARLVKDGRLPYFYKWKKGDGLRYYDPNNFDSLRPSIITVSPFYLQLLEPLADLPQSSISKYWLLFEYGAWVLLVLLFVILAPNPVQKQAVVLFSSLFLLTNAWKDHTGLGQSYLWIPLLAGVYYAFLRRKSHPVWGLAAGVCAACLVLIRINTLLFFLPFISLFPGYSGRWLAAFCIAPLLLAGWTLLSPHQRSLWFNYSSLLSEQIKVHQDLPHVWQHNEPDPHVEQWEGIDKVRADSLTATDPDPVYSENGNVFVLYQKIFGRRLPLGWLGLLGGLAIVAAAAVFLWRWRFIGSPGLAQLAIFSFCLYMISDLFSPVYRHQYYTVQWLMPLLVAASLYRARLWRWYAGLSAALLLSIFHLPVIKMGNTAGEYLFLGCLLAISLHFSRPDGLKSAPAGHL